MQDATADTLTQMDGKRRLRTDTSADMLTNRPKNREGGRFALLRRRGKHSKAASSESATGVAEC